MKKKTIRKETVLLDVLGKFNIRGKGQIYVCDIYSKHIPVSVGDVVTDEDGDSFIISWLSPVTRPILEGKDCDWRWSFCFVDKDGEKAAPRGTILTVSKAIDEEEI